MHCARYANLRAKKHFLTINKLFIIVPYMLFFQESLFLLIIDYSIYFSLNCQNYFW